MSFHSMVSKLALTRLKYSLQEANLALKVIVAGTITLKSLKLALNHAT